MTEVLSNIATISMYEKLWHELSVEERRNRIQSAEDYRLRGYYPTHMNAEVIAERIYTNTRSKLIRTGQSDGKG
jgi:hypothetical protein